MVGVIFGSPAALKKSLNDYFICKSQLVWSKSQITVGDPNLSSIPYRTVAYRTVPYRFP